MLAAMYSGGRLRCWIRRESTDMTSCGALGGLQRRQRCFCGVVSLMCRLGISVFLSAHFCGSLEPQGVMEGALEAGAGHLGGAKSGSVSQGRQPRAGEATVGPVLF